MADNENFRFDGSDDDIDVEDRKTFLPKTLMPKSTRASKASYPIRGKIPARGCEDESDSGDKEDDEDDEDFGFGKQGDVQLSHFARHLNHDNSDDSHNDSDSDSDSDSDYSEPRTRGIKVSSHTPQSRPDHFARSVKIAERSAARTKVYDADSFLLIEEDDSPTNRGPKLALGSFGRARSPKQEPARTWKRVLPDLDSDDEMILSMRDEGYTDAQISYRLKKEGRINYSTQSLGPRVKRVKEVIAAHVDYQLAEGYKEWTLQEDQCLMQAFEYADIEVRYEIERAMATRFKKTAEYMRRFDKDAIFSEKAVRERYQALMAGTARIPIDEDDDPNERRKEMEEFRAEREEVRAKEKEEAERKKREGEEEEEKKRAALAKRTEAAAKKKKEKREKREARKERIATKAQRLAQEAAEKKCKRADLRREKAEAKVAAKKAVRQANTNAPVKVAKVTDLQNVTVDTPDPRLDLELQDLVILCKEAGVDRQGNKEELVKRLKEANEKKTKPQLMVECRKHGLNSCCLKHQLIYQLAQMDVKKIRKARAKATSKAATKDAVSGSDETTAATST
ncbi:hypothetical protein M011DRAFT_148590 [Sporormia fimetaria CBS 119925]|uniref:SAP domain-containing protein n=1 Tax=Sporormia fimetaria CBS 119925 TaxID=1340428 RepID=A0A6A6V6Z9_9PLEO|nr:hypothetical protein M011DRAFT_148590 [Sporormia fimetaria CBS 119925]